MAVLLFILGLAVGSFLDVVASRYDPDTSLLSKKVISGRSRCTSCGRVLKWFELIPLLSFITQAGRCRSCQARLSFEYPLVEVLSGLIFVFVPRAVLSPLHSPTDYLGAILWVLTFLTLLLVALIDLRTRIIPDEASVFLASLGILLVLLGASSFGLIDGSFAGGYAALFGIRQNIYVNHLVGFLAAAIFFALLVIITRGRGMGGGDVKLAAALGILFGWPDVILITALAFMLGSVVGLFQILFQGRTLKSFLPFGPFLALGSMLVFFFGEHIIRFYFQLF